MSTHVFHESRLTREHVVHIAAHGFEAVELFATRAHFDYPDAHTVEQLGDWLSDTRLELHSLHAPICEYITDGAWVRSFSNASGDATRRAAALAETRAALQVARRVPFRFLVVHLGVPSSAQRSHDDNQRDLARRSLEDVVAMAADVGVRVAVEVIPNRLSGAAALVELIEEHLDGLDVGVCFDYGHAHLMGDLTEGIEAVSGHLWTTHIHDNGGQRDEHLVPFSGSIDWSAAIMATQKIGYEDVLMLEVANTGDPIETLQRSATARERLDATFLTM